ncbi:hypothetical protein [Spiroplasma endosymbiont of Glossina fuscipes fuscipes]|uniref:hypothetical protein n=1 Tax=Spiroplasma endosymbiont of Glossina fuscipes fuscipes TaxID=2004463 RepID=UPI003C74DD17
MCGNCKCQNCKDENRRIRKKNYAFEFCEEQIKRNPNQFGIRIIMRMIEDNF